MKQAMIFAAGLGTRLKPITDNIPKALVPVNGKTLLRRNVEYLHSYGISEICVNIHHFPDLMRKEIEELNYEGLGIIISDESDEVLETGGGLLKAAPFFHSSPVLVMNVDILTDLDIAQMLEHHQRSGALATLAVLQRSSGRGFLFDENMRLCGWKNTVTGETKMVVENQPELSLFAFSGLQIIEKRLIDLIPFKGKFSMVDVYLAFAKDHLIKGYDHSGSRWIDVGKVESLERAREIFHRF